jgi:dienelactone hydrolase
MLRTSADVRSSRATRVFFPLAAVVAAAVLAASNAAHGSSSRRPPLKLQERCVRKTDHARIVRFRASDRVRLLGVSIGTGPVAVALAHESDANLCNWLPFARVLARHGYRALAFDFRNSGSSAVVRSSRWDRFDSDLIGAAAFLRRTGAKSVFLAGASMGGTAALVSATRVTPPVSGVISLSGPATYGSLDAETAVQRLHAPVIFIAGEGDPDFASDAKTLYDATSEADKQLKIVSGYAHGTFLLRGPGGADVRTLVLGFVSARAQL